MLGAFLSAGGLGLYMPPFLLLLACLGYKVKNTVCDENLRGNSALEKMKMLKLKPGFGK